MLKTGSGIATPVSIANGGTNATSADLDGGKGLVFYDGTRLKSVSSLRNDTTNGIVVNLNGLALSVQVFTATGTILPLKNSILIVNKASGAASAVSIQGSSSATVGQLLVVKDGKGDAATNNITITPAGGITIDGAATLVISANYGVARLIYNGTQWNVI